MMAIVFLAMEERVRSEARRNRRALMADAQLHHRSRCPKWNLSDTYAHLRATLQDVTQAPDGRQAIVK